MTREYKSASDKHVEDMQPKGDKRHIRWLVVLGIVVGTCFGLLVVVEIVAAVLTANGPYCASVDPTECSLEVRVYNDTNVTYAIQPCVSTGDRQCQSLSASTILKPGMSYATRGVTDSEAQPYLISDKQGKVAGCLNLAYTKEYTDKSITVPLSKLTPCKPYL